jgi:hypothetical protein
MVKCDAFFEAQICQLPFSQRHVVSLKQTSIFKALMMEAVRTSETSIYFNLNTRWYIQEDCHIHVRC